MSYPVANLNIASDTFAVWVTRTNTLLNALSNYVVTVDNSASGVNAERGISNNALPLPE